MNRVGCDDWISECRIDLDFQLHTYSPIVLESSFSLGIQAVSLAFLRFSFLMIASNRRHNSDDAANHTAGHDSPKTLLGIFRHRGGHAVVVPGESGRQPNQRTGSATTTAGGMQQQL